MRAVFSRAEKRLRSGTHSPTARFVLDDPAEARALLIDAAEASAPVVWANERGQSGAGRFERQADVLRFVPDDVEPDGPTRVAFVVYGVPFFGSLRIERGSVIGDPSFESSDERRSVRVAPPVPMMLEWYSSETGYVRGLRAPLIDVSESGARSLHPSGSPLPDSDRFPATLIAGDTLLRCMVEVRSRSESSAGSELGLKIVSDDHEHFVRMIQGALFPNVQRRRDVAPEQMIELFDRSGYLALRSGTSPSPGWLGMDADGVTRDLAYVAGDGRVLGHVSITRAYRHAWLGHQIATVSDHTQSIDARRSLYSSFAMLPSFIDGPEARLVGYYNRSRPWHQIFFEQFARSVDSSSVAVVFPLDRFEIDASVASADAPSAVQGDIEIGPASARDSASLADLIRRRLPPLLADTYDIHPSRLTADAMHPAYAETSLSRSREAVLLRVGGRVVGGALCELTTRDLSLFNVMNMAQFFTLDGVAPEAKRALSQYVQRMYAARGVDDPIFVAPPGTFHPDLDRALRHVETMGCIAWSSEGLRAYANYVQLRFAWLQQGQRPDSADTSILRLSA